ncbi:MAG: tRNA pseudouridine(13) synthase TruD [Halieaceae bacterium]|jgi:tRNA pseudouridine13 synthase|nr:tRNA pseudouridine(13) synthase TruD [Halieaceae bacterium]
MTPRWPRVQGEPQVEAVIRSCPEDFTVCEQLGFDLSGEGEHVFLHLQKRQITTAQLVDRVSVLSDVPARGIGFSGLKDRNALTRQWISVGLAGKPEPTWQHLEQAGDVQVLAVKRHLRKLKRGVHQANRFVIQLRQLQGHTEDLERRLHRVRDEGVPNYFGEQRFGSRGATLEQALGWMKAGGRKISRTRRSMFLSVLRSCLFNTLLADRVDRGSWNQILEEDVCMLQGSRSHFICDVLDDSIMTRMQRGDIHPGLPLWGCGSQRAGASRIAQEAAVLADSREICQFLERMGLDLTYRSARLVVDDFYWEFCDDKSLRLEFCLGAGAYATAILAELVNYTEGCRG